MGDMKRASIGRYLQHVRWNHDEKLYDMAAKIDVSPAFLSNVERGRKKPSIKLLVNLSYVYGLDLDVLIQRFGVVNNVVIQPASVQASRLAVLFAKRLNCMTLNQMRDLEKKLRE